eukprot:TRINITY_DN22255_c0_g2_i1.p1 TRINITY_DN22255_c0_g2~~TRINITY_DN22255_c0_g2_i1.p1  ORF type:complete len:597 (-),score=108.42 TRINITY_DN22255_c0_g2_i1:5-1759(-)
MLWRPGCCLPSAAACLCFFCAAAASPRPSGGDLLSLAKAASQARLGSRLEALQLFLERGGARRCDLPRVELGRLGGSGAAPPVTWAELSARLRGRPALLLGVVDSESNPKSWSQQDFVDEFGEHRVKTNNGHFDHLRSKEVMTLAEFLAANASEWNLFFADMAYPLQADVSRALTVPPVLHGFDARPILSVGVKASSTRSHTHVETWQLLLAGLKAWWISSPGADLDRDLGEDPCTALRTADPTSSSLPRVKREGGKPLLCVQRPGEVMYFGDQMPHATCNLESFVLGIGAQGSSEPWASELHRAAHRNDTARIQRIIEEGGELNAYDHEARTALHRAVAMGHAAAADLLVSAGAGLRAKDREGKNAAAMAAERGDLRLLQHLTEAGCPVKRPAGGGRPHALHWAALSGHRPVIEYLLSRRASVSARDAKGTEPLHFAALESDVSTVALLVEDFNANFSATGHQGEVPLHWAAGVGHVGIANYLMQARADPRDADARGTTALHFAAAQDRAEVAASLLAGQPEKEQLLSAQAAGGVTPLHAAASLGHARLAALLLAARAPAEVAMQDGEAQQQTSTHRQRSQFH